MIFLDETNAVPSQRIDVSTVAFSVFCVVFLIQEMVD